MARATLGDARIPDVVLLLPLETAKYDAGVTLLLGRSPMTGEHNRVS